MAETRKFDYVAVSNAFKNMTEITGDASTPDSIAGILHDINNVYREYVDKNDMAIYGDLGKQLLLDWDNTSSDFPSFVTNFENWANLIANAAGAYQQFEQDIANTKVNNPLGTSSAGLQQAYTSIGNYSGYDSSGALNIHSFVGLSGMGYIDTDMESYEKQRKTSAMWSFGLNTVSTILSVIGGGKVVGAERAAGKTLTTTVNSIAQNGLRGTLSSSSSAVSTGATTGAADIADTPLQQRINNAAGVSKPPASANGAPTSASDSIFNSVSDAELATYNSSAFSKPSGLASINGAPTGINDSIFASATDAELAAYNSAAFSSSSTGSLLGAAQAPDMSLAGAANKAVDFVNTVTKKGGVDPWAYAGLVTSEGMEKIKTTEQVDATEQTVTSEPVPGVMGNNATITESIYSR